MSRILSRLPRAFDRWLFASNDPNLCSILRVAYAVVMLIYFGMLYREAERWFADSGVIRALTMNDLNAGDHPSLLFWISSDTLVVHSLLLLMLVCTALLLLGCWSRLQVICIFLGLVTLHHRNTLIFDGQDVLARVLAFYLIFLPLDHRWSLSRWWLTGSANSHQHDRRSAWGLRLIQFQITIIYLSTAWEKFQGVSWRDGTALYYVARMDDLFGRFWLPDYLFETPSVLHAMTWSVLILEALLPIFLWLRPTRRWAVLVAMGLHLFIEYAMHIFLFEWLMIIGLLSFVDPAWLARRRVEDTKNLKSVAALP